MSRGHGRRQREILTALAEAGDEWVMLDNLAGVGEPSRSEVQSTRRAVQRLHAEGLVDVERRTGWGSGKSTMRGGVPVRYRSIITGEWVERTSTSYRVSVPALWVRLRR